MGEEHGKVGDDVDEDAVWQWEATGEDERSAEREASAWRTGEYPGFFGTRRTY